MPRQAKLVAAEPLPDGDPAAVVRRAPFSANPQVGARGRRAQQRILDAALQVFGEDGYHDCGVIRITEVAGCSRAAFYQYFTSKEDVFRHLAGQVVRQLASSAEALGPITPDEAGWQTLRAWIGRHGEIYDHYEPVFRAFQAAAESDEAIATGAARTGDRHVATIRSKLARTTLPPKHVDAVLALLLECMSRTHRLAGVLQAALPRSAYPRTRVDDALADVVHRTLTGLDGAVNVHPPAKRRPPAVPLGPVIREAVGDDASRDGLSPTGARTRAALLAAGHDVLVARGYHGTRVDDITEAAGVSHGAFYRYFENKEHLIRLLAARAMGTVAAVLAAIPTDDSPAALRQWLRRYNSTHAAEMAMFRVWLDSTSGDRSLNLETGAAVEWGRSRMVRFLQPRGFGDVDTEALVMVALLDAFGDRRRAPSMVDAAAHVIERGLLARS